MCHQPDNSMASHQINHQYWSKLFNEGHGTYGRWVACADNHWVTGLVAKGYKAIHYPWNALRWQGWKPATATGQIMLWNKSNIDASKASAIRMQLSPFQSTNLLLGLTVTIRTVEESVFVSVNQGTQMQRLILRHMHTMTALVWIHQMNSPQLQRREKIYDILQHLGLFQTRTPLHN